ncbi:MAG: A24 family peptidase [Thermoguttaceae bacterium]|nr:A24 family peptidase [Thermoguttaceae bacterium]
MLSIIEFVLAAWLFALGSVIGSFLNVVVYRLPRGMSLSQPGSHCPNCKHPIRWYDNVPILGWFALGGRCRDCGLRISLRYPAVEAVTAALFLWLGLAEFFSGGANLPQSAPMVQAAEETMPSVNESAAMLCYHLLLVATLLTAALIDADGQPVPWSLAAPALLIGGLAPAVWRGLHPVPALPGLVGWPGGLADSALGLASGLVIAAALRPALRPGHRVGLAVGLACTGTILGWQAAVVLALVTLALHLIVSGVARLARRVVPWPPSVWLAGLAPAWIATWRFWTDLWQHWV